MPQSTDAASVAINHGSLNTAENGQTNFINTHYHKRHKLLSKRMSALLSGLYDISTSKNTEKYI